VSKPSSSRVGHRHTLLPLLPPTVQRRSTGGKPDIRWLVLLLSGSDRQLGLFAIACGYPNADDLDDLRCDPAIKLACRTVAEER
jgi:hypothetical protein